jgi:hypothetical protein
MEMGAVVMQLIQAYCAKQSISWKDTGQPFFRALQKEAMANMAELVDQVPEASQRMWTSFKQLDGKEFCFILNFAVRSDDPDLIEHAAVRTIPGRNNRCASGLTSLTRCLILVAGTYAWNQPPMCHCWRWTSRGSSTGQYLLSWRGL